MKTPIFATLSLVLAFAGCDTGGQLSERTTQQALDGLTVLDVAADGDLLAGTVQAAAPNTDADRIIVLDRAPAGLELEGTRVMDARLTEQGVLTIGPDHTLTLHTPTERRTLDVNVWGPLSVENERVAYVRGHAPDLSLLVLDLATGLRSEPAPDLKTTWSPALSDDADEVIVAASIEGQGVVVRIDAAGQRQVLDTGGRVPSSALAPTWRDGAYTFDGGDGEAKIQVQVSTVEVTR